MRQRDPRYEVIKPMLNEGKIQVFPDVFKYIRKSVVAADLGKRGPRFTELISKVEDFTVKELQIMARLFGLTLGEMFRLVEAELERRRGSY